MEKQYVIKPSLELQASLITLGSSMALEQYVAQVKMHNRVPDKGYVNAGPTWAIATIKDPCLLPILGKLIDVLFTPGFEDNDFMD